MQNAARKLSPEQITLEEGTVIEARGGLYTVRVGDFDCTAKRARSCLVDPEPGSVVLVSFGRGGRCFVLALLEGEGDESKTTLAVEGDLEVKLTTGRFGVSAARGVALTSGEEVSLVGQALNVSALSGTIFVQKLAYLGSRLKAEVEAIKTVGAVYDSVFERISQRVKRSFRTVEDVDQLKANKIDYAAETTMALRAEHAVLHAEELVKVDAKQIQMG